MLICVTQNSSTSTEERMILQGTGKCDTWSDTCGGVGAGNYCSTRGVWHSMIWHSWGNMRRVLGDPVKSKPSIKTLSHKNQNYKTLPVIIRISFLQVKLSQNTKFCNLSYITRKLTKIQFYFKYFLSKKIKQK